MSIFPSEITTYESFSKICRCCIINRGEMNVFEAHLEDLSLATIIDNCTNEKISKTDGLPREICNVCVEFLVNYHMFLKTFKIAQNKIKSLFERFGSRNESIEDTKLVKIGFCVKEQNYLDLKNETCFVEEIQSKDSYINERIHSSEEDKGETGNESSLDDTDHENEITLDLQTFTNTENKNKKIEVDPQLTSNLDLQCFQCLEIFSTKTEMTKHHETTGHIMAPNYKCGICSKTMSKRKAYWDHMAMHRHTKQKAVCEICGAVVIALHLKRHMLVHQKKSYVCQYCKKEYAQKTSLTDHVKRKHKGESKNTLCFICGKLCSDLKTLTSHLRTHTEDTRNKLPHHCSKCGKHFLNAQSLNTHNYMAHKVREKIPTERKQKPDFGFKSVPKGFSPKKNVEKEPKECLICHKTICSSGYARHLTTHSDVKPHQCKQCPKSFRLFSSLKSHMYVHLGLKPFECEVCKRQFRHYTTLKVHKRVHSGERPYVCCVCKKGFISASGLKRHKNQRQHWAKADKLD